MSLRFLFLFFRNGSSKVICLEDQTEFLPNEVWHFFELIVTYNGVASSKNNHHLYNSIYGVLLKQMVSVGAASEHFACISYHRYAKVFNLPSYMLYVRPAHQLAHAKESDHYWKCFKMHLIQDGYYLYITSEGRDTLADERESELNNCTGCLLFAFRKDPVRKHTLKP